MKNSRKKHGSHHKAEVALAAMSKLTTIAEIASQYKVHPTQVHAWKSQLKKAAPDIFSKARDKRLEEQLELNERLFKQIGQLTVEVDWLKKKSGLLQ
jgi:transposase